MKASTFSEVQIAFVLKQTEGDATVVEVCRRAEIRVQRIYGLEINSQNCYPINVNHRF